MYNEVIADFAGHLHWLWGSVALTSLLAVTSVFSFARNAKKMLWYLFAALLLALFVQASFQAFPYFLDALNSWRSDWSLVFVIQSGGFYSWFLQFLLYFFVYGSLGILLVLLFILWSFLTFRWQRIHMILERSLKRTWFVLVFTVSSLLINTLWFFIFGSIDQAVLEVFFKAHIFLFLLQFFVRLIDGAKLDSSSLFTEFLFSTAVFILLFDFLFQWGDVVLFERSLVAREFFFGQLFAFFWTIMVTGYLATFFVRAWFASGYFLERYHQSKNSLLMTFSQVLLSKSDRHYAHQRTVMGIIVCLFVGAVFLFLVLQGLYLVIVPGFFLAYFFLFLLLDRQEDMRLRGDLVNKRIESAVHRVFLG